MMTTLELEAKYVATDPDIFARLMQATNLSGFELRPKHEAHVTDRYLDTAERDLLQHGYALRIREEGGHRLVTLKHQGHSEGAIHEREEVEAEIKLGAMPHEWPDPLRGRVFELTEGRPLHPLVTIRQQRTYRDVLLAQRHVATLSFDVVAYEAGGERRVANEVEAEIEAQGSRADLRTLDLVLQREGLKPMPYSKVERVLRFADTLANPAAVAVETEEMDVESPLLEAWEDSVWEDDPLGLLGGGSPFGSETTETEGVPDVGAADEPEQPSWNPMPPDAIAPAETAEENRETDPAQREREEKKASAAAAFSRATLRPPFASSTTWEEMDPHAEDADAEASDEDQNPWQNIESMFGPAVTQGDGLIPAPEPDLSAGEERASSFPTETEAPETAAAAEEPTVEAEPEQKATAQARKVTATSGFALPLQDSIKAALGSMLRATADGVETAVREDATLDRSTIKRLHAYLHRLDAVLTLFKAHVAGPRHETVRSVLHTLAAFRDLAAVQSATHRYVQTLPQRRQADLQPWRQFLRRAYRTLETEQLSRLRDDLETLPDQLRETAEEVGGEGRSGSDTLLVRHLIPAALWAQYARVQAFEGTIPGTSEADELLELRDEADVLQQLLKLTRGETGEAGAYLIGTLRELRQHLAPFGVAASAASYAARFEARATPAQRDALQAFRQDQEARTQQESAALAAAWEQVSGRKFRRMLGEVTASF